MSQIIPCRMERLYELINFFKYESDNPFAVEPARREDILLDRISDAVRNYNPAVTVKAGAGNLILLAKLASIIKGRFVVVDPSIETILKFKSAHPDTSIDFICGEFNLLPVDYYAADMLICADNLNFLESGRVVDEFRRVTRFEGHLFISAPVVHPEDFDGVYDDLYRAASPLHTDYYMAVDLVTFLELNEFQFIKGDDFSSKISIAELKNHFAGINLSTGAAIDEFLKENTESLRNHYSFDGLSLIENWFSAVFMRKKPEESDGKLEATHGVFSAE